MKRILVIGAGRSSANLIKYLTEYAAVEDWMVRVGDMDVDFARQKIGNCRRAEAFQLNASDHDQRRKEIEVVDLVISMLPASMHMLVARDCLEMGKNVITPSYIPDEMWSLDEEAKSKGVLILNEMGVDPGIDHMSAMKIIHELIQERNSIVSSHLPADSLRLKATITPGTIRLPGIPETLYLLVMVEQHATVGTTD
jgi:saccharopine dehydrogenase-like NADP-dependent oxidoreductase